MGEEPDHREPLYADAYADGQYIEMMANHFDQLLNIAEAAKELLALESDFIRYGTSHLEPFAAARWRDARHRLHLALEAKPLEY